MRAYCIKPSFFRKDEFSFFLENSAFISIRWFIYTKFPFITLIFSCHYVMVTYQAIFFPKRWNQLFFGKFSFYFDPLIYRYEISFHNIFQWHCEIILFLYNCQRHCENTLFFVFFPKSWNSAFLKIQLFSICLEKRKCKLCVNAALSVEI